MTEMTRYLDRWSRILIGVVVTVIVYLSPFGHSAYAQTGKIVMPTRVLTLKQALDEVRLQTDYKVAVSWDYLDPARRVTLPASEMEIKQYLLTILSGTAYSWDVINGQIAITPITNVRGMANSTMYRNDFAQSQLTFVPDPWSRTQVPFDNMVNTRVLNIGGVNGRDSLGMAVINFKVSSSVVERDYMDNAWTLDILHRTFINKEVLASMDYVVLTAGSSPEGNTIFNEKLASERVLSMKSYIMSHFPFLNRDMIYTFSIGEDWTGLRKMVEDDLRTPRRDQVLRVLDMDVNSNTKRSRLKAIDAGYAYRYISQTMLPKLRGAAACTIHYKLELEPTVIVEEKVVTDTVYVDKIVAPEPELVPEPVIVEPKQERKPLFAAKTNLLFDLVSVLNVEVEIPIGQRWSIAAEYIFPWWLWEKEQYCMQIRSGNIEGRYWLGKRSGKQQLTGWHVGLYTGLGTYDIEWGDEGRQGEFFIATGVSGGYAHSIGRNLRMEYSLGVGYMKTNYDQYVPHKGLDDKWYLIYQKSGTHKWVGPTRARVSLVWMFNHGYKKRGGVK